MLKRFRPLIVLLFICDTAFASPYIKVRIGTKLKEIKMSGFDLVQTIIGRSEKSVYKGKSTLRFNCNTDGDKLDNKKSILVAQIESKTGFLAWNNEIYKGRFDVTASPRDQGCDLINEVPFETYISALLAKEMNQAWPNEALKAQAVAARTYAYHIKTTQEVTKTHGFETYYDLESSEKHQVTGSFTKTTNRTKRAASETEGEVLVLKSGKLTPIFFHAKCGGRTLKPENVWSNKVDGYRSVSCPFCHKYGMKDWEKSVDKSFIRKYLNKILVGSANASEVDNRSLKIARSSAVEAYVRLHQNDRIKVVKKSDLRSAMGRGILPSNYYTIEDDGHRVKLKGKGYGHGVGMCQLGAFDLAKRGYNYKQILAHYFPEHKIEKLY